MTPTPDEVESLPSSETAGETASPPEISGTPDRFTLKLIEALGLDHLDVAKVELRIGPRTQSAVVKLKLTPEQAAELNAMVV